MILITGASGHLGEAVIRQLLQNTPADHIIGFVRDEGKAAHLRQRGVALRIGTYDDTDSLDQAMRGVETVLLIAGTDEENRLRQHQNVVDAAQRAGVGRIAYTGRALKDRNTLVNRLMMGHFQTEDYIKQSGLTYTLFQNILYVDAIPQFVGPTVFERGIYLPAGQGRVSFALRSDMGEAIANALVTGGRDHVIYQLTGTQSYSFTDVATALTDLSGKDVTYTPVETAAFESQLKQRGVPDAMVGRITGFITDIANGQEDHVSPDLAYLLGRKPTPLKEGLKSLYPV